MKSSVILEKLFLALPLRNKRHSPKTKYYKSSKRIARKEIERLFASADFRPISFKPFGKLTFPYHRMGNVDSLNLFDLDELIIFSFYWLNRNRYRHIADIGANIGLHSIILEKCGFKIHSYEPDPQHLEVLQRNIKLNNCSKIKVFNLAVSTKSGQAEFIRVLGNTTGSHLVGSKLNPLGRLEKFPVKTGSIIPIIKWADFLKIDAEGHEKDILLATSFNDWLDTDALIEVGSENNAQHIFEYFEKIGVNLFAQKINWQLVTDVEQMPTSYHDGSLFITSKDKMPWQ